VTISGEALQPRLRFGAISFAAANGEDLGVSATDATGTAAPWRLATLVVTTVIVLWIALVYSLGESVEFGRRLTSDELRSVAVLELSIPLAAMARPAGSYSAPMEC
jgi:hypothetical protein